MRTVAALALLAVAAVVRAADPSDEVARLRAENARLEARVRELEAAKAEMERRCPPPVAAAVERAADEKLEVRTSPEGGVTHVATERSLLDRTSGGVGKHWLTVRAARAASGGAEQPILTIDTAASGGIYRSAKTLRLVVDGAAEDLPVTRYESEPIRVESRQGPRTVGEREAITVALPPATLARISGAREVTGTLGPMTFRMTTDQVLAVRALAERVGATGAR